MNDKGEGIFERNFENASEWLPRFLVPLPLEMLLFLDGYICLSFVFCVVLVSGAAHSDRPDPWGVWV